MDPRQPSAPGPEHWAKLSELFEKLLDSTDPERELSAIADPALREAAAELWRHHRAAVGESFLDRPLELEAVPVFESGQLLLGRFEIRRLAGVGGMGEVYLAFDRVLREETAIKTIPRLLASSPEIRERFLAEVQNARRVTHRNVCRIFELFEEGGNAFFSMEWIDGIALTEGEWTVADRRRILYETAQGLDAAHRNGIIHGDFKPSNVMIEKTGRAVVMDFGLARAFGVANPPGGVRAGTAEYMAPELLAGGEPAIASDLYAFGKVAEWLLPDERFWRALVRERPSERPMSLDPALQALGGGANRRTWIVGSVVAAGVGGYAISRIPSGAPKLAGLRRVLLNGFDCEETRRSAALVARSLMVTVLRQSARVAAVADEDLLPALRRAKLELPLRGEALERIAAQHRASHWIEARLDGAGTRVSLAMAVHRKGDPRALAEVSFSDMPSVAALAARAAAWLRKEAGESESSLASSPASFLSETPEALEYYFRAMRHYAVGEMAMAIPPLEEAVRLDPDFAQAHHILGMCLTQQGRLAEGFAALSRAMELAAALPPRERTWIEANYAMVVDDPTRAIEAGRRNVAYFPEEPRFERLLAHFHCRMGDPAAAIAHNRRSVNLAPGNDLLWGELVYNLADAGRFQEALDAYREAEAKGCRHPSLDRAAATAYLGLDDYANALRLLEAAPGTPGRLIHGAKALAGDLESALAGLKRDLFAAQSERSPIAPHQLREGLCGVAYLFGKPELAGPEVDTMADLPAYPSFGRFLRVSAFWTARFARWDAFERVGVRLGEIGRGWPTRQSAGAESYWRGLAARRAGDMEAAAEALLASDTGDAAVYALFDLAELYRRNGKLDLAEEYWRKFESRRGTLNKLWFPGLAVQGWLLRAEAARQRGDRTTARVCAKRILDRWPKNSRFGVVLSAREIYALTG
ncbi:MAG: serine/threonine-protein kinase [Bryobacteraceae bacterium]|nr:serine/threonine-protein kinase [Bryobacteraceae bacterium]